MKAIKFLFFSLLGILFASCAGLNTTPYTNNQVETKLILSEGNYRIVKEVNGEWSATYVLGIGGLSKRALKNNAISKMYQDAHLTGNQQIINVTTTQSAEVWALGIYMKVRAMAHGYVIEFLDSSISPNIKLDTCNYEEPVQTIMPIKETKTQNKGLVDSITEDRKQEVDLLAEKEPLTKDICLKMQQFSWQNSVLYYSYCIAIRQLKDLGNTNDYNLNVQKINSLIEQIFTNKLSKRDIENIIKREVNTGMKEYEIYLKLVQEYL